MNEKVDYWQNSWLNLLPLEIFIDANLKVLLSLHWLNFPVLLKQTWSELPSHAIIIVDDFSANAPKSGSHFAAKTK